MTAPLHAADAGAVPRPIAVRTSPTTALAAGAGAIAVGAAVVELAGTETGPEVCIIRRLSGGYCPGCGGARACRHLLHGDLASAWADHPWVVLAAAQLVAFVTLVVLLALRTRAGRRTPPTSDTRRMPWAPDTGDIPEVSDPGGRSWGVVRVIAVANLVALGTIWVVRLAQGDIPSPL